jgi:GNAT superfamily N-acetyltransferase
MELRRGSVADARALAAALVDGVADYAAFAGPGWAPPSAEAEAAHLRELLADERVVCLIAEEAGELVGQVSLLPAALAAHAVPDAALGHVANVIVRRDHWGAGLARTLHTAAVGAAAAAGYAELRLFVAAGQSRARRFYEREGWQPAGEPFDEPALGLVMVEYRRPVPDCG